MGEGDFFLIFVMLIKKKKKPNTQTVSWCVSEVKIYKIYNGHLKEAVFTSLSVLSLMVVDLAPV